MFGPDVIASVTTQELRELVRGIRFIEAMRKGPSDKDQLAAEVAPLRKLFIKSLVARRDLPAGHQLTPSDVCLKKPGTGLPAEALENLLGKTLKAPLLTDQLLRKEDFQ
jgi:N-acetylneuraminate synthase